MVKMDTETSKEKLDKIEDNTMVAWKAAETGTKDQNMEQTLKPLLFALALAGCFNFTEIGMSSKPERTNFLKSATSAAYRVTFLAMILLYLCKNIAACFYMPPEGFVFNLQVIFWLLFSVSTYIIYVKSTSQRYGHHKQAFHFWKEEIMPDFKELQIQFPTTKLERYALAALIFSIFTIILNVAAAGIQIYMSKENLFLCPFEIKPLTLGIFCVIFIAATTIWIIPIATVLIFSIFLREAFNALNQYGQKICNKNGGKLALNFDKTRRLHLNLCKLVGDLDQDLGWYFAASFVFNVGCSAFQLYQIMRISMDTVLLVIYLFWFSSCSFIAVLTATHAARLNEAAHAPLDTIYYINVQDITVEKLAQLNLFLSKLTGTQVGFSTCGLLIITKEFILTIAGVFLTYFAVLYTL